MLQDENKRYKANIAGKDYTIIGNESHYHMDIVNDLANEQLTTIMKQAPTLTQEQAAILLAINTLSVQVKQQESILKLKKENEALQKEVDRKTDLEERISQMEEREKEARLERASEKREPTEKEMLNQIELQKVMNQQVKEKIQRNNHHKKTSNNK